MNNPFIPSNYYIMSKKIKRALKGILAITLAAPMYRVVYLLQTQHSNPQFK